MSPYLFLIEAEIYGEQIDSPSVKINLESRLIYIYNILLLKFYGFFQIIYINLYYSMLMTWIIF